MVVANKMATTMTRYKLRRFCHVTITTLNKFFIPYHTT